MSNYEYNKKYAQKWDKNNLKQVSLKLKLEEFEMLEDYCKSNNIPKNGFIRNAIVYAIKNNIM